MSTLQTQLVKKTAIMDSGDFNLSSARYLEKVKINSDYEVVSITDTFQLIKQSNKIKKNNYLKEGMIPIIDQSIDFVAGYANAENGVIDEVHPLIIFGDHTRVVKFINFKFLPGADGVKILKPNIDIILPKFLYNMLKSIKLKNLGYSRHFKLLKEVMIPLPPLEIQEQIVKEIEGYQQIIDGCRQVVENYKPVIDIDPSWKKIPVKSLVKILSGYAFASKMFNDIKGTPIIRIRDIKKGFTKTFYNGDYDKKYLVVDGSLLIGMDGEFNIREWNGGNALLNQRVCKIYEYSGIYKKTFEVLMIEQLKNIENITQAVTVKHISIKQINKIELPVPSMEIQKEIVKKLEQERKVIEGNKELIKIYEKKINDKIKELF